MTGRDDRAFTRRVERLVRNRRARTGWLSEDDRAALEVAITLTSARHGDQTPRPVFVRDLEHMLARRLDRPGTPAGEGGVPGVPARRASTRRRVLQVVGAVAAAGAGFLTARALPRSRPIPAPAAPPTLVPDRGGWRTVMTSAELTEGTVHPFSVGPVSGFVERASGRLRAVSAVCTDQGCRLAYLRAQGLLRCPCHGATFALTGRFLSYPGDAERRLPALPRIPVRESGGAIQVYTAESSGTPSAGPGHRPAGYDSIGQRWPSGSTP